MSDSNRWTMPELLARYELEPQLQDVFVEGSFDREVLSCAVGQSAGIYSFYEIDVVDVPSDVLKKHGLSSGNKQRVIALAHELSALTSDVKHICLVDKDLDHWFGPLGAVGKLRWTMFCSLEHHFLNPEVIRDVLITSGRIKIAQFEAFVDSLHAVLRELYILRLVDRQKSMNMTWVSTRKYLAREGDVIRFDVEKYKTALLTANNYSSNKAEFDSCCVTWRASVAGDIRQSSRGHDYVELLAWAMREFRGLKDFASETAIERILILVARSIPTIPQEVH